MLPKYLYYEFLQYYTCCIDYRNIFVIFLKTTLIMFFQTGDKQ